MSIYGFLACLGNRKLIPVQNYMHCLNKIKDGFVILYYTGNKMSIEHSIQVVLEQQFSTCMEAVIEKLQYVGEKEKHWWKGGQFSQEIIQTPAEIKEEIKQLLGHHSNADVLDMQTDFHACGLH